jgi:hypothetical protein
MSEPDDLAEPSYPTPQWQKWLRRDRWRLDQAIALSLAIDPDPLSLSKGVRLPGPLARYQLLPPEFYDRLELAGSCAEESLPAQVRSAEHPASGELFVEPAAFVTWLGQKELSIPPELVHLATSHNSADPARANRPRKQTMIEAFDRFDEELADCTAERLARRLVLRDLKADRAPLGGQESPHGPVARLLGLAKKAAGDGEPDQRRNVCRRVFGATQDLPPVAGKVDDRRLICRPFDA